MQIKQTILYFSCFFFPIVGYIYARKLKRGITLQVIETIIILIGTYSILYSIGRYAETPKDIETFLFVGISLIIPMASIGIFDSVRTLYKHFNKK